MKNTQNLCEAEVKKNIILVETGQPLTLPLRVLNESCEFKKAWDKAYDIFHPEAIARELKAYREKNKDKLAKKRKAYYEKNKDKLAKKRKAYREKNKDKIKAYYEKNKDKIKAYYEKNKDKLAKNGKAYREKNKDKINKKGYILYRRHVVECFLKRLLPQESVVHHIDFNKLNNKIENLMLFKSQKEHAHFHKKIDQFGITQPILTQINNRWDEYV